MKKILEIKNINLDIERGKIYGFIGKMVQVRLPYLELYQV